MYTLEHITMLYGFVWIIFRKQILSLFNYLTAKYYTCGYKYHIFQQVFHNFTKNPAKPFINQELKVERSPYSLDLIFFF